MRGKATAAEEFQPYGRITPAYAGKRQCSTNSGFCIWDHPRLCGEKPNGYVVAEDVEGSPPPMRGKERNRVRCRERVGITPAYAGKSSLFIQYTILP